MGVPAITPAGVRAAPVAIAESRGFSPSVKVARGSFSGIVGTIIEMDDRGRLVVLMNLLCRLVKVQVAARVVVPA